MKKILSLVKWFCRKLSYNELLIAASIILEVLNDDRPDIKPKDSFKIEHPHYGKFDVDPKPPLTECPPARHKEPSANWQDLLEHYRLQNGKEIEPVKRRNPKASVPASIRCSHCNAPAEYMYYNDGKKRSQLRCKVCTGFFQPRRRYRPSKAKYWCPHCNYALYRWKQFETMTIYKCPNNHCSKYLSAINKLNPRERALHKSGSSQFKLRYQYREYHFDPAELIPACPECLDANITRIHSDLDTLGLVLTFNISCGLSARMTAYILKNVFSIRISHQTVLNYAKAAAVHCHRFNLHYKAPVDSIVAGDETYVRVMDKWNYTWFTINTESRSIAAYHLSDTRGTKPALITLKETIRDVPEQATTTLVADGNPSYDAAVHAINAASDGKPLKRRKVIGLENLDPESEQYRPFKQLIERLNRTYKFHTRARCGFKDFNGAISLTALFVTYYNFLRPHTSLRYRCPVALPDLAGIRTLQGRWGKVLQMATALAC